MTPLWTAEAVATATGGEVRDAWTASGVSIDTRTLAPGDLFVALVGPNRDAHDYVAGALRQGAATALVNRVPKGVDPARLVLVPETQAALEALGRAGRARSRARIAGITGSVGKTGTKEALRHVLAAQAATHASAASHNNHWGVPLSLAKLPEQATYGVFELGMNHEGEIRGLVRQVRPHVALITRIAPAHLAHFASIDAIADAKAEIFQGLEPGGVAVLNRDDAQFPRLQEHARATGVGRIVTFGEADEADWRLVQVELAPEHSDVIALHAGGTLRYRVGLPGRHWAMNSLAVLAVVEALGADADRAAADLAGLQAPPGRGVQRRIAVTGGEAVLLDESYNANPVSMRAALALLGQLPGRRIAALGDMLELGERSGELHAGLAEAVAAAGVDLVFTCGPHMEHLHAALPPAVKGTHAVNSLALAPLVREALCPGDVLLVKGSLGSRMAHIVEALTPSGEPTAARAAQ